MATEDQVGIRLVSQITFEVRGQDFQDLRLTVNQATRGILGGGPSGWKVNTMESEPGFQLLDLRGRGRRRWRGFHVHHGGGRGRERGIAVIAYVASDRDMTWLCAPCIQRGSVSVAGDLSGAGGIAVSQPAAIRAAGARIDG